MTRTVTGEINSSVSDKLKVVRRIRYQVELSAKACRANVAGAYASQGSVAAKTLLIDDVVTTGATLTKCADVLRKADAGKAQALSRCTIC